MQPSFRSVGRAVPATIAQRTGPILKPRSPRQKVLIKARIRVGAVWSDACILDISKRGLMAQSDSPPPAGAYLELKRGARIIIGRVMWSKERRFGISTQDPLDVEAIIGQPDGGAGPNADRPVAAAAVDQHAAARAHERALQRSRQWSRAFEFLCVALLGLSGCVIVFGAVEKLFARPLAIVAQGLSVK